MGRSYLPKLAIVRGLLDILIIILSSCGSIKLIGDCILLDIDIRNGFTKLPNFIYGRGLTPTQISILAVLYQHIPNVNPSIIRISLMSGASERSVHYSLLKLEELGFIKRMLITGKRSIYLLHNDHDGFISGSFITPATIAPHPCKKRKQPLQPLRSTPATIAPKQYKEQYKEQENKISNFIDTSQESIEDRKKFIAEVMFKKST